MKNIKVNEVNLIELMNSYPKACALLHVLAKNMDDKNAVLISNQTLSEIMKISLSTIKRAIKYLLEAKYIMVTRVGKSNVYHINSSVFQVKKNGEGCLFTAVVSMGKREMMLNEHNYDVK